MRLIKKKKGNKEYYYIQNSIRKGKKVITKEYYVGKTVPKDINQIMQKIDHESKKELYKKLERIKFNFQNEWKKLPESVKEHEKEEISIAFTYNTNAIEGSTITLYEAREIIKDDISPHKPIRDVKETESHSYVFLKILDSKEAISIKNILKWHKEIFGESKHDIAGDFRKYLVRVGNYVAPDWQDVNKLMIELINFIDSSRLNSVELSARAHYKFEKIHPFGDGNGRIGRLLMNYLLWRKGYPMMIIEYNKRKSYYKALEKDEEKFVNYFIRRYLSVHKKRYM